LVLADGVSHVCKHINPDVIVDMATLTGAQSFATGYRHAGVLSNSEEFEKLMIDSGKASCDLAFPLIYAPEFHGISKQFASEIADMKNTGKERPNCGSSSAGLFINEHMSPEDKWKEGGSGLWAHVDMAFPVAVGERGSGYGVALLVESIRRLSAKWSA
jgi:probable aminopeptidase NPEPL1